MLPAGKAPPGENLPCTGYGDGESNVAREVVVIVARTVVPLKNSIVSLAEPPDHHIPK